MQGFSAEHQTEVLASLRDNVLSGAQRAVKLCTDERKYLTRLRQSIIDNFKKEADAAKKAREAAKKAKKPLPPKQLVTLARLHADLAAYNQKVSAYLARRRAAEDALGNLEILVETFDVPDLCKEHEDEIQDLLGKLNNLQYHGNTSERIELLKIRD